MRTVERPLYCLQVALARGNREPGQAVTGAALNGVPLCEGLLRAVGAGHSLSSIASVRPYSADLYSVDSYRADAHDTDWQYAISAADWGSATMPNDDSSSEAPATSPDSATSSGSSYVVVARRYRPLSFDDLVGQQQMAQALINAINTNRVGHAYLFTGARGVGKTSTARIFAKALNAPNGPTPNPDNDNDICRAIDAGEDVDVIEIDGASNRGIDEIRQLRSNANVRPSRARYKIYIIDEVHMLTTAAFNALLKTLEEPPAHVKFIFCTTDPQKIPITVLSRCQRYDFAPVDVPSIVGRLEFIVTNEGRQADPEALQLLARRAEGSMRDSQSLLEQLMAYCSGPITLEDVHQMLGTAAAGRLAAVTDHMINRDAAGALGALDDAVADGVDCGQLAEQLLGYMRDMMVASLGCPAEMMRLAATGDHADLAKTGKQFGLETTLATFEILDQAVTRMRQSTQPRTLLEIAIVRVCNLENLDQLATLIAQVRDGTSPAPRAPQATTTSPPAGLPSGTAEKKKPSAVTRPAATSEPNSATEVNTHTAAPHPTGAKTTAAPTTTPTPSTGLPAAEPAIASSEALTAGSNTDVGAATVSASSAQQELTDRTADSLWKQALDQIGDMTSDFASYYDHVVISSPDSLVVHFREAYTLQKESCEQPERKAQLEKKISQMVGRRIRIDLAVIPEPERKQNAPAAPSMFQLMREKENHPFVRQAVDLFDAEVIKVDVPRPRRADS